MARSRWEEVKEKLLLVEKWARDGLSEEQIAKNLGISCSTLNNYKVNHVEIIQALKRGKVVLITEVENALIKKALGFEYIETKVSRRKDGGVVTESVEKTTKYSPPDTGACALVLKNKDKEHWSDNPNRVDTDKRLADLQERALALKEF